jgi:release factor glutamine methyltransferase
MPTLLEIIQKTTDFLASKGVESARLNAEQLVGHALALKRMQLYLQFERVLAESDLEKIRPLVKRRAQREPLQHILGTVEWGGLTLKIDRRALVPRPETEELFELVVKRRAAITSETSAPPRVLDLGTGSGALALALAQAWPDSRVTAVDASDHALALAAENATFLGLSTRVTFIKSDWFSALPDGETFDVIVSNPPYLSEAEVASAEPEVRVYDPREALVAPDEGLADLRSILRAAASRLAPGGLLALETGIAHHCVLLEEVSTTGLAGGESVPDLSKRDRFILAWR